MIDIEKLEDLPRKAKIREGMGYRDYSHGDYPWKRVKRWILSKVGQNINDVTKEFVKLLWIPKQYRTFHQLSNYHIETNTFLNDKKEICFFLRFPSSHSGYQKVNEYWNDVIYVNPVTKVICFHKQKKTNWTKIYREREAKTMRVLGDYHQLLKLNGIWYEVKAEKKHIVTYYQKMYLTKIFSPTDRLIPENGIAPHNYYSTDIKIILKKELNSKELKKFGLKNDVVPVKYGRLKN